MSKEYELDLFQNSIDSLNESIKYYHDSIEDESKYKFCIILLSHFMELLLKYLVEKQNPLLCFEKPYSEKIKNKKTITWGQAIQVLINCNVEITDQTRKHLQALTKIRNDILHYKFSYNTETIRNLVISIISDMRKLFTSVTSLDFYDNTKESTKELINKIQEEYTRELHLAQSNAVENANREEIVDCGLCGEEKTAVLVDGNYYHCYFCDEDDYLVLCDRCGSEVKESDSVHFGETEDGNEIIFCDYCNDDMFED